VIRRPLKSRVTILEAFIVTNANHVVTIENVVAVLCRAACYPGVLTYRAAAENPPESSSSTQIFTQDQLNAPNTTQDIFITSTRDFVSWVESS
jgi:hypothetical protein